jgi:hypothetical protein
MLKFPHKIFLKNLKFFLVYALLYTLSLAPVQSAE